MWREAMMQLLDQLEAENPEDPSLAPKELSDWAVIYIKYLQIFRRLETAYDQMLQPQKRQDMKKALEACMGRMLEIRHWMRTEHQTTDRAKELNDRERFLQVLLEKYQQAAQQPPEGSGMAPGSTSGKQPTADSKQGNCLNAGAPLMVDEAVAVIIRNERGRQARERGRAVASFKRGRALEERRRQTGVLLSKDQAATRIQSVVRGHLARTRVKQEAVQELMFVGMRPQPVDPRFDPQVLEARHLLARKQQLLDPENGTLR
eukprot:gene779-1092_t